MKKSGAVLFSLCLIAAVILAFFLGGHTRDQAHEEARAQRYDRYLSFAIDTVEDKGLSVEGAAEAVASNLWVAHELCDDPERSAQLSDLWNTLVYDKDVYTGQEAALAERLKGLLEHAQ